MKIDPSEQQHVHGDAFHFRKFEMKFCNRHVGAFSFLRDDDGASCFERHHGSSIYTCCVVVWWCACGCLVWWCEVVVVSCLVDCVHAVQVRVCCVCVCVLCVLLCC